MSIVNATDCPHGVVDNVCWRCSIIKHGLSLDIVRLLIRRIFYLYQLNPAIFHYTIRLCGVNLGTISSRRLYQLLQDRQQRQLELGMLCPDKLWKHLVLGASWK